MTRTPYRQSAVRRPLQALLLSASAIAVATPAMAAEVVFATERDFAPEVDRRVSQTSGLTQIRLDSGAVLSFVDAADYRLNADGSVDLYAGSVTVAGAEGAVTVVRMPDGLEGRVGGGAAASFSVTADGTSRGHALTGEVTVLRGGNTRAFDAGEMWAANDDGLRQVVSNGAQQAPGAEGADDEPQVADMAQGGPAAAAANGVPVSLPDALAFAGASSDIVLAARNVQAGIDNPAIGTFPTGDLALLVSYAAQLDGAYGGQADIIRTYLGYLAQGGAQASFLSAYAGFLTQYLDLIRAGALPSSFQGASPADVEAFIAYTGRTSGFASYSEQNRALVEAYLQFLSSGGNRDLFARSYTDLVGAYFAFLRGGGDPLAFEGASQQTLAAYIGFLSQSGLAAQLSAADRALLDAYLANGGLAFTSQYRAALNAYFAYLEAGNLPSGYTGLDAATLRSYLEALQSTGLFEQALGAQAEFYAAFLAHLQSGGAADGFALLNANVFTGYAGQLAAYYEFLLQGGQPSGYTTLTQQQISAYLAALQAAGASGAFLDDLAEFYAGYFAYLSGGGNPDLYTGLPSLNLPGFADALNAYAAFLAGGGLPSGYAAADLATLGQYLDALSRSGQLAALLGANADLLNAYFAYFANGGAVDRFAGLPLYASYVDALQAYYAFLDAGGLPADYTALTAAQIRDYLAALATAGGISVQLGDLSAFFTSYYAFIAGGGNPANFVGLPVYADYAAALQAYYAFLAAGGLPADYTALTEAQIQAYLAALSAAGGFSTQLGDLASFYTSYYAFIAGGGDPADFGGLPVYANWLAALEAYYAYLGAGGLPSGYTVLTAAQIRAYIEALDGAGVLAAELNADALEFILAYLAYVETGADPDDFAELPANSPTPTLLAGANGWIFSNEGGQIAVATAANVAGDGQIVSAALELSPGSSVTFDYSGAGNTLRERGRVAGDVAWTRYERGAGVGVTNSNVHLLLGTPAVNLPATGTVDYRLIGGTAPTNAMAPAGEIGAFSGDLAVAFGSTPRVGLEFDVHVGTRGWHSQTPGGAAGAETGGLVVGSTMRFSTTDLATTGIAGNACSGYCNVQVYGGLFGDGAGSTGLQYFVDDQSSGGRSYVNGVAVFGTAGTEVALIGTMPATTPPASVDHPASYAYAGGFDTATPATVLAHFRGYSGADDKLVTLDTDGTLLSAADNHYAPSGGDSVDVQGDALGILGRFTGGDLTLFGTRGFSGIGANTGAHWVVLAAPSGTMPATGTIEYDLLAATHPTFTNGVTAAGSFDGDLTLTFGASAIDGNIAGQILMPESGGGKLYSFDYDFSTTAATLAQGLYVYDYQGLQGSGLACPTAGNCSVNISLAAGGTNGADRVGMTYETFGGDLSAPRITGAALFGAPGSWPATGAPGGGSGAFTGTRANQVYYTYTNGSLALGFGGSATLEDGKLTGFSSLLGTTTTTGQVVEAGDLGDMAWARWTGGDVVTVGVLPSTVAVGANGGYHVMSGTPVTSLPASGTVDYALIASTSATDNAGSAPGTVSGDLAIAFGALNRVGYDLQMAVGGRSWAVSTAGGAANPSASDVVLQTGSAGATFGGVFTSTSGTVTAGGGACQATCTVNVGGSLYGANGVHAGVAVNVLDASVSASVMASGLAIFSADPGAAALLGGAITFAGR